MPFHSYGVEIGSWYGDDVNYIAKMVGIETKAYEENGVNACTKHFVARGGRSNYFNAKSPANLVDSWLVGWKSAVIDNGSGWIMLNNGKFLNNCNVCYDSESMAVLRQQLGYDGCVVTDWPMWMQVPSASGTTPEGLDLSTASVGELYATIFNADVDQVGCFFMVEDDVPVDYDAVIARYPGMMQPMWPNAVKEQLKLGNLTQETIDKHAKRVLRNKFELGLFEDPYGNLEDALELCASDEYKAQAFDMTTIEDVYRARTAEMNAMEIQLQTESTVLLKNDNILPLKAEQKVYVAGTSKDTVAMDKEAIAAYATVVDNMEDADVIIAHVTAMDDATELLSVLADMLYGVKAPSGKTVFEMAWTSEDAELDWGELQFDTGVDTKTRLYMAAVVRNNPTADLPTNLGDVMYPAHFGMRYDQPADITCNTLIAPQGVREVSEETSSGTRMATKVLNLAKAGETFEINFIAENNGADGYINVEVLVDGELAATKMIAVSAGSFRVVTIPLTLDAGEHVITVGGMTANLTVE